MTSLKKSILELKHASSSLGTNISNNDPSSGMSSAPTVERSFGTSASASALMSPSMSMPTSSSQMLQDGSSQIPPGQTTPTKRSAGESLLSSRGIDMNKMYRQTQDLATSAARQSTVTNAHADPSTTTTLALTNESNGGDAQTNVQNVDGRDPWQIASDMGYTDARSFLDNFHFQLMENIISQDRLRIQNASEEFVQSRITEDWNNIKMEQYGISSNSNDRVDSNGISGKMVNGTFIHNIGDGSKHWPDSTENIVRSAFVQNKPRTITPVQEDVSSVTRALVPSDPSSSTPSSEVELHWFAQEHLHVLPHLNLNALSQMAQRLSKEYQKQMEQTGNGEDLLLASLVSYHNASQLLDTMFQFDDAPGLPLQENGDNNRVYGRCMGAMSFLAKQFQIFLVTSVKNISATPSSLSNSGALKRGFSGDVWTFVETQVGRDVMERGSVDVAWRCLYYCLRCGDAVAGSDIISSYKEIDPAVIQALLIMAQKQGSNRASIFNTEDTIKSISDAIPRNLHQNLLVLYQRAHTQASNNVGEVDEYELACLALLSLSDATICSNVTATIEDYLYAKIWNAVHSVGSTSTHANVEPCGVQIASLGEDIKHWGPSHFEEGESSHGWEFALPLLLCQQFKSAFVHLANIGGGVALCQCTHLALAMSLRDIRPFDWQVEQDNEDIVGSLLIAYSSSLEHVAPAASLRYVIHVTESPDGDQVKTGIYTKGGNELSQTALKQICRIVLDNKAYQFFGGETSLDGSRNGKGTLDEFFPHASVNEILSSAADQAIQEGSITDGAQLLSLAEKYSSLLSLLNRELASRLVVHEEDDEEKGRREFWCNAAINFHSLYLSQGRSYVVMILEKENTYTTLGLTFQRILNLMTFFDRCSEEDWQGALELMDNLDFLPKASVEISRMIESFHSLANEIQQVFHHVITKTMECICRQHSSIKKDIRGDQSPSSVDAIMYKMKDLRERGKYLLTFAGLIPFNESSETKSIISKMDAFMV